MKKMIWIVGLIVIAATVTMAQQTGWGGKGKVSVDPARAPRGGSVEINYSVFESRGTGTAEFRCEVTGPGGVVHLARTVSSEWSGGRARGSFAYPGDFGGNDEVRPSTRSPGTYQIQCYWYIDGYGVNGKVAAAGGAFVVE